MDDRTAQQPALSRGDVALRYLGAVVPMLAFGTIWAVVASRNPDALPVALGDVALGLVALALMGWRRRFPLPIGLGTAALSAFSTTAVGPAMVAYVSLCTHRRWRQILPVAAVWWVSLVIRSSWYFVDEVALFSVLAGTPVLAGLTIFGLYVRSRRDLEASQREAELTAEREQQRRIEQAKLAERAAIAQEMHDVLAHRLSLVSMLAGGLAYRADLGVEETRATALSIHENAHQSLNELRTVLGTLRADGAVEAPQPTLAHVHALFDEVRAAGQHVEVDDTIEDRELLPTQTGRHAYRIVQEALTNARKHAPGSRVMAEIGGAPGEGLRIRVSNPVPAGMAAPVSERRYGAPAPGAKLGLVGLTERARMAGGTITHAIADGRFVLEAQLPWED